MKPGYLTTEFWLTIINHITGILLMAGVLGNGGELHTSIGLGLMGLGQTAYTVSRGIAKKENS